MFVGQNSTGFSHHKCLFVQLKPTIAAPARIDPQPFLFPAGTNFSVWSVLGKKSWRCSNCDSIRAALIHNDLFTPEAFVSFHFPVNFLPLFREHRGFLFLLSSGVWLFFALISASHCFFTIVYSLMVACASWT